MAKNRITFNSYGFARLRDSAPIRAELNRYATRMADAAGEGFEARLDQRGKRGVISKRPGKTYQNPERAGRMPRARASVGTTDPRSMVIQSKYRVLERVLGSVR